MWEEGDFIYFPVFRGLNINALDIPEGYKPLPVNLNTALTKSVDSDFFIFSFFPFFFLFFCF